MAIAMIPDSIVALMAGSSGEGAETESRELLDLTYEDG